MTNKISVGDVVVFYRQKMDGGMMRMVGRVIQLGRERLVFVPEMGNFYLDANASKLSDEEAMLWTLEQNNEGNVFFA